MARAGECGTSLSRNSSLDVGFEAALQGHVIPTVPQNKAKRCPGIGRRKAILLPLWTNCNETQTEFSESGPSDIYITPDW